MAFKRIMLYCSTVTAVLHSTLLTNATTVTVLVVQPPIIGKDGSAIPTRPLQSSGGYSMGPVGGTLIVSAVGPAETGFTKYEVQIVQSRVLAYRPGTTQTIISVPHTATIFTVEQGAGSVLRQYGDPSYTTLPEGGSWEVIGLDLDCVLDDGKKTGVCTGANLVADISEVVSGTQTVLSTRTQTLPTTFTGAVYPMATLVTSNGIHARLCPAEILITALASVVAAAFIAL